MPFNRSPDKLKDSNNDINSNTSPRPAKRQRPVSPRYKTNLHYTSTPPPPLNKDIKGSGEHANSSDSHRLGDDILPKRQKLSDSLGGRTALSSHNRLS